MERRAIAIVCSDLHIRDTVPPARAAEPDWYAAMARPIEELREEQARHAVDSPIFLAGDIFHKPNASVQLVNWFIGLRLPNVYAIPGQHDLPYHSLEDIRKSAYWTLVEAGAITHITEPMFIEGNKPVDGRYWVVHPFPWGIPVEFPEGYGEDPDVKHLALVHHYLHMGGGTQHPAALPEDHVDAWHDKLDGFAVAVFGDNHCPFTTQAGSCTVVNNGGMMLVNSNDRNGSPGYSLLYSDGTVERRTFDTSQDKWVEDSISEAVEDGSELGHQLIESLTALSTATIDYREGIRTALRVLSPGKAVAALLLDSIA